MSAARNNAAVFCLFLVVPVFTLIMLGCESPGSVGGSFTDPGTEVRDTVFSVSDVRTDSFSTFSGNLAFFSAGRFNDPLFGNVSAMSLIKPALPRASASDSLVRNTEMNLRLVVNSSGIYGDTLSTAEFDLIEIDGIWRGRAWQLNDEIELSQNQIGSFEIDSETDTLEVPLAADWVSRYRAYYNAISANRDSLYRYDFQGLAIVPRNESKIIPFSPAGTQFVIINPGEDTSNVSTSQWAFSLDRTNKSPAPTGSSKVISTFEKVLKFDLNLTKEDLGTVNISKVELVFYQNAEALDNSIRQASPSAKRPSITTARLFLSEPQNVPEALTSGTAISSATYDEADGSFRFDITRFTNSVLLNGIGENNVFYVTLQSNNGIIESSLLYNNEALDDKKPKVIVTFVDTK